METNGNGDHGLSTRALLCSLSISTWGNRKMDKTISKEAAESRGMGERIGRYNKWLLIEDKQGNACKEWRNVISIRNKAAEIHRSITLPWTDDGSRITTALGLWDWQEAMKKRRRDFEEAVDLFLERYPALKDRTKLIMDLAAQEERKPSMFNEKNYPSRSKLETHFAFATDLWPLPESKDFRVKLTDDQVTSIKHQIDSRLNQRVEECVQHLYEKLQGVAARVMSLGNEKTLITKALARDVVDVSRLVRKLNLAENRELDDMASRIEKELAVDDMLLKTAPEFRSILADKAKAVLDDIAGFMSVGGEL